MPKEWKEGPDGPEEMKLNKRQILKEYWARWGKWLKYQPLDHIRFVTIIPHSHMLRVEQLSVEHQKQSGVYFGFGFGLVCDWQSS